MDELLDNIVDDEEAIRVVKDAYPEYKASNKITKFYGMTDKWYIQRMLNPTTQYKYAYVFLDSNNAAPEITTDTQIGWKVINYVVQQTGTVSTVNNIRDVVGVRIYPVSMKLIAPIVEPGKVWTNNVSNLNSNFTILIHEFQAQSYVGRDGRKFHFSLFPVLMNPLVEDVVSSITPANPYYECTTESKCNGWVWFKKPITEFNSLTLTIANPFNLVNPQTNIDRIFIPLQLVFLAEKK